MVSFKPYFDEENGDLTAYDVFINDGDTPMGWIELRENEIMFTTNDSLRWFDVLSAADLREIANFMENDAKQLIN